ncbi:putative efflux pump periplasmic linker TtgA precursor [Methyloligella halotolerans]|uniref:Putative efflux pump periplasmic linker TtgA n=1 Tax=Methyloligella halotolerans TaxID=1177755 RepID=A0A1E2S1L2_9HYPH|nr:efflux RND transporter periplasmic adaptor subunit [Methyloligella halotolerans]ODA68341.1 putative efflux pump periplasmic linker TtgA precursor [Methyloligella halotolerans]
MTKRFIIVGLIIAVFLGGLAWFQLVFKPQMIEQFVSKMQGAAPTVTTEEARTERWTPEIHAIGTVTAIRGVNLAPEISGIVEDYFFESGDDVEEGKLLVQLDDSVQRAELAANKATLKDAEINYDRQSKLVDRGAVSQAALDTATANRDSARAAVDQVSAIIEQKSVEAPFSGRIGLRTVEKGQYVPTGEGIVWLQALDPIWIDFPVPESAAGRIELGDPVRVNVDSHPERTFEGKITARDVRVSSDTRTLTLRATLKNLDKVLLPGMFGDVTVDSGEPKQYVTVPKTAVTYSLYGDAVWVAVPNDGKDREPNDKPSPESGGAQAAEADQGEAPDGQASDGDEAGTKPEAEQGPKLKAERRFVRVGPNRGDRVAILEGVKAGEEVITSGQLKLQPDSSVEVDNSERLKAPAELPRP